MMWIALWIGLMIYFLPSMLAQSNAKKNTTAILLLNIFAGWTFVGWVVALVWAVTKDYRNISMPEFDASLLSLMGISSGTYLGFKFPEKPKT